MRKSLWSPDEDEKLKHYVSKHGCGNWSDVAKHTGLKRCGKSCRLRWINYLRPDLKRGPFLAEEIRLIVNLHRELGNSWSKIATYLPGRTDNDVKNFWHSYTRSRRVQQPATNPEAKDANDQNSYDETNGRAAARHSKYESNQHLHNAKNGKTKGLAATTSFTGSGSGRPTESNSISSQISADDCSYLDSTHEPPSLSDVKLVKEISKSSKAVNHQLGTLAAINNQHHHLKGSVESEDECSIDQNIDNSTTKSWTSMITNASSMMSISSAHYTNCSTHNYLNNNTHNSNGSSANMISFGTNSSRHGDQPKAIFDLHIDTSIGIDDDHLLNPYCNYTNDHPYLVQELAYDQIKSLPPPEGLQSVIWSFLNQQITCNSLQVPPLHHQAPEYSNYDPSMSTAGASSVNNYGTEVKDLDQASAKNMDDLIIANPPFCMMHTSTIPDQLMLDFDTMRSNQRNYVQS